MKKPRYPQRSKLAPAPVPPPHPPHPNPHWEEPTPPKQALWPYIAIAIGVIVALVVVYW